MDPNSPDIQALQAAIRAQAAARLAGVNVAKESRLRSLLKVGDGTLPPERRSRAAAAARRDAVLTTLLGGNPELRTFVDVERALGWKQGAVQGVLWRWELRRVSIDRMVRLSALLGVSLDTIVAVALAIRDERTRPEGSTDEASPSPAG